MNNLDAVKSHFKYIFVKDFTDARIVNKRAPECIAIFPVNPRYSENIYEIFMNHINDLRSVYESLIDEDSRRAFRGYWLGNITYQTNDMFFSNNTHYLTQGFIPKANDIVIDCGACDGWTAVKFVNLGCKVYAFEMDKHNFELAKKLADEKGFIVENLGLGSYKHEMKYTHVEDNIGGSHADANGTEIAHIVKLDTYVGENKIPRVDFIKMDVEGAELDILMGAADTISRCKPILALSVYHKWDDFWTLTNFVKSIRSDYEFAMRHYPESREDVPFMFKDGQEDLLVSFGLEPNTRWFNECVLFAR